MRVLLIGALFLTLCLFGCERPGPAVCIIDIDEIFQNNKESREMYEQLQKEKSDLETKGQELLDEINTLVKESELLSDEARREREARIREKTAALEAFRRGAMLELMEKTNEEYRKMMDDVKSAAEIVAKKSGITIILDKSTVAFSAKKLDVTKEIIAELNSGYKNKQGKKAD